MRTVPCNVCGEARELEEVFVQKAENLRVVRCRSCGLVFVNPTFTPPEHLAWYGTRYWNDIPNDGHGNYVNIPADKIERWTRRGKGQIDYLAMFCEAMKTKPVLHLLEVGCGYGAHLEEVHRRCPAAKLYAIEPNTRLYASLRQRMPELQILGKTLETLSGVRMMFDCIILSSVLEHSSDPSTLLKRVYTLLQPTGLCLIVTHNAAGRMSHVYDLNHLCYFSEGSLQQLLGNCHLQSVRVDLRDEFGQPGSDCLYLVVRKR